ncbi:hypothetical protein Q8A67_014104 [Cirrhinus molitorella]|uniref:Apolipoprotein L2 n=1 Tax=Cirrhinus molitorella TaxID=172907 RepID=A0AA88THZ4_9TELE|nr:hypothetical protein Q8A67_014104 [Cirrhinus molitorella]
MIETDIHERNFAAAARVSDRVFVVTHTRNSHASVVRRGLELFNEKDGVKRKQKKSSSFCKSELMEQISTDKQGVKRRIRQLQRPGGSTRSKNTVKDKHIKSALDEYRKKQKKSHLQANLSYFLGTGSKTLGRESTKIMKQISGRRACDQTDQPASKAKEKSVFTEADFESFQKEYFAKFKSQRIMLCSEEANTQAHGVKLQPVPKKPGKDSLSRHSCDVTPVHENVGEIQEPVRSESDQSLYVEVLVLPDDHQDGDDCAAKGTCFSSNLTESGGGLRDKSGLWAGWDDLFDAEQQEDQSRLIAQTVHRIRSGVQLYQRVLFDRGTSMMNFITQINCIADELDKKMKKLRIADITGITVGASGTAAIFAGIALVPVTSGLWLAVSGIGICGAVSGVITSVSVAINKKVKKTLARRKVEKILQSYQTQMVDVEEGLKFIISGMKHLWRLEPGVGADAADVLKLMERLENSDVIDALSRNTHVVQAFVADLDSYFTKDSAQRLKKGSGCSFAAEIREVALKLKENIDQLIRIKNMFR